jgi:hypothetical protein
MRPECVSVVQFLESCGGLDGSESAALPMLEPVLHPSPSLDSATTFDVMQAYYERKERAAKDPIPRFTCIPWAPVAPLPRPARVGIVIVATEGAPISDPSSAEGMSMADKQQYARQHGYGLHVVRERFGRRTPHWSKFVGALAVLHHYDWVMCLDLDTLIMDHAVTLDEFLDHRYELIISTDGQGLNAGVFFLSNGPWTRMLLLELWTLDDALDTK